MPIDSSFFPSTEGLTTYVDDQPRFTRKQLVVQGPTRKDEEQVGEEEISTEDAMQTDLKFSTKDKRFRIEKIYHAQCLEKYPNHFSAFVRLSIVDDSPQLSESKGDITLLCLTHYDKFYNILMSLDYD